MKPLALCSRLIDVHSNPDDTIVVPFAGSGSEMLAAAKAGRRVVGFDNKPEYIELVTRRFAGHNLPLVVSSKISSTRLCSRTATGVTAGRSSSEHKQDFTWDVVA
jgi:hypothetical protein